jgi:hypothetical protein
MSLRPFDEHTLDHFIFTERPEGMDLPDAPGFEPVTDVAPAMADDDIGPTELPYASVGHLYRQIEDGLTALTMGYGEPRVFIGPPSAQATSAYFPFPGLMAVTDLASARKAIELIVEQGEGLRGDIEGSHYARFLAISGELDRLRAARPDFEPARPVMENPFTEPPADATAFNLLEHPAARSISELLNASYALMVGMLMRFFAQHRGIAPGVEDPCRRGHRHHAWRPQAAWHHPHDLARADRRRPTASRPRFRVLPVDPVPAASWRRLGAVRRAAWRTGRSQRAARGQPEPRGRPRRGPREHRGAGRGLERARPMIERIDRRATPVTRRGAREGEFFGLLERPYRACD